MRIVRILNLLGVRRADGRELLAALDCPFHQIDAVVVFDEIPEIVGNAEQVFENIERIFALIFDIVNREHRTDKLIFGTETVNRL